MTISFYNEGVAAPRIKKGEIRQWVAQVAAAHGRTVGEVSYIFCGDERILEVNRQFLQHDYYTDIITFDYTQGDRIAGDLFISLDTVRSNADLFGQAYETELHRVIIHGILHLCGIDDKGPGQREVMERHENEALDLLSRMRQGQAQ